MIRKYFCDLARVLRETLATQPRLCIFKTYERKCSLRTSATHDPTEWSAVHWTLDTSESPHIQIEAIADPIGLIPELVQHSLDELLQV